MPSFSYNMLNMLNEEITDFLKKIHPFNFLSEADLDTLIVDITMEFYPRGTKILVQDGPPSDHLNVIKKGGVKVYVESESEGETVIDYRSEGEQFGLLSLVSGDRSRANVVAIEDTICYLISKDKILAIIQKNPSVQQYFLKSFVINFIDKSHSETREKYLGSSETDRLLFNTQVGELLQREPITALQETPIRRAAEVMVQHKISSLVIVDAEGIPVGMVTDRDLREKVVAQGMNIDIPVSSIMSSSLVTVNSDEYCFEALLRMVRHKIHHIIILDNEKLAGIVTNHDFMVLQGNSPTVLVKEVGKAKNVGELQKTVSNLYKSVSNLLREGAKAYNINGLVTEYVDKAVNRAVDLVEANLGPPPVSYTLFLMGEGGRRELTLNFQTSFGIVYDDPNDHGAHLIEEYFGKFIKETNDLLEECWNIKGHEKGFVAERVKSFSEWHKFFELWGEAPDRSIEADFFEMRAIRGDAKNIYRLRDYLLELSTTNKNFMDLVAAITVNNRPPLGFFKKFVVDKEGEHKNELNINLKGIKPLIDSVRLFTVKHGIPDISTLSRLRKLKNKTSLERQDDIGQVLEYLFTFLLHQQLLQIEEGKEPDNFINPDVLSYLEKKTLKESFLLIASLYNIIEKNYMTERVA